MRFMPPPNPKLSDTQKHLEEAPGGIQQCYAHHLWHLFSTPPDLYLCCCQMNEKIGNIITQMPVLLHIQLNDKVRTLRGSLKASQQIIHNNPLSCFDKIWKVQRKTPVRWQRIWERTMSQNNEIFRESARCRLLSEWKRSRLSADSEFEFGKLLTGAIFSHDTQYCKCAFFALHTTPIIFGDRENCR